MDLREYEEPPSDRVLEEEQFVEFFSGLWELRDDDTGNQAQILRDEVVTGFSDPEQGKQTEALCEGAGLALDLVFRPDEIRVAECRLDPTLGPAESLLPEC